MKQTGTSLTPARGVGYVGLINGDGIHYPNHTEYGIGAGEDGDSNGNGHGAGARRFAAAVFMCVPDDDGSLRHAVLEAQLFGETHNPADTATT